MLGDKESGYRAKIILLKADGYTIPEIRRLTNHHDSNIRKWIHRFNEKGIDGIASKVHKHKPTKITDDIENKIIEIVTKNLRTDYGHHFQHGHYTYLPILSSDLHLMD